MKLWDHLCTCLISASQGFLGGSPKHLPEGGDISPYCLELSQVLKLISALKRNCGSETRDSTKFPQRFAGSGKKKQKPYKMPNLIYRIQAKDSLPYIYSSQSYETWQYLLILKR